MRPGIPTRLGEVAEIEPVLAFLFENITHIEGPGTIEPIDIFITSHEVIVGQTRRTNSDGIEGWLIYSKTGDVSCVKSEFFVA